MWELYEKWVWETGGYVPRKTVLREMARYRSWLAGARYMKERCAKVCDEFGEEWICNSAELGKTIRSINTEE